MTRDNEIEKLENEIAGLLVEKDAATDAERKRALRARVMDLRARLDPLVAERDAARVPKPGDRTLGLSGVGSTFRAF